MKYTHLNLILLVAFCFTNLKAVAYPQMVKHGYVNCSSCHVSPSGGGILTKYGREISSDLISSASNEGEAQFLNNIVTLPNSLDLGGDVKVLGYYDDEPHFVDKRILLMQAEAQVAWKFFDGLSAVASAGIYGKSGDIKNAYLLYQQSESNSLRVGKFTPAFGINLPEHAVATRDGLGISSSKPSVNAEYVNIGEKNSFYATAILLQGSEGPGHEMGMALRDEVHIAKEHQVGLSFYVGQRNAFTRHMGGPFAVVSLSKSLTVLNEEDFQYMIPRKSDDPTTAKMFGLFTYNMLDWEMTRGVHGYLVQDLGKKDLKTSSSLSTSYGIGAQYFPRPHYEINASYRRQKNAVFSNKYGNTYWLVLHCYL